MNIIKTKHTTHITHTCDSHTNVSELPTVNVALPGHPQGGGSLIVGFDVPILRLF